MIIVAVSDAPRPQARHPGRRSTRAYVGTAGTSSTGVTHRYYSCNSARKFGPTSCDGPNLPANELEDLVTDQLLATYRDPALFDEALSNRRREHADRHGPLTEELDGLTQTIAKKERVRRRYQDDYESGELSAARYESRAAELDDELDKLRDRAAELQAELEQPDLPAVPDQQQLALLRDLLTEQVRGGDIAVRKALFEVLVDRIDVHDADDIRPRYRLYDPVLTAAFADQGSAEQGRETAQEMSTFDCHRAGWS